MLRVMGQVNAFEIPRGRVAHVWWVAPCIGLVAASMSLFREPTTTLGERMALGLFIAILVAVMWRGANRVPRTARLRATGEGVRFGGRAIVPWHEITAIYEAGVEITYYSFSAKTPAINIGFHRRRTLLRVPVSLWFTTLTPATVKIALYASELSPSVVVARLEAVRIAACGHENGVLPGASEVPAARIVVRS